LYIFIKGVSNPTGKKKSDPNLINEKMKTFGLF